MDEVYWILISVGLLIFAGVLGLVWMDAEHSYTTCQKELYIQGSSCSIGIAKINGTYLESECVIPQKYNQSILESQDRFIEGG